MSSDAKLLSVEEGSSRSTRLSLEGLTVARGGRNVVREVSLEIPAGEVTALLGPNGAGKSSMVLAMGGILKPVSGTVSAFGEDLLAMTHYRRARWGVRRTFQTEQAIEELSVYDNVAMIHENSKATRSSRREDVLGAIEFVKLDVNPNAKVGTLGAAARRLVEVARAVVG